MERARLLFGSYRKGQADDPEVYVASISAVLSEYPPDVVEFVTDPRTGIQKRKKWLPDVPEVVEACEDAMEPRYRARREEKYHAERAAVLREEAARAAMPRPTMDQLRKEHGANWGMKAPEGQDDIALEKRRDRMAEVNKLTFEKECESAGFPLDSPVSPSLAAILHQKRWVL